MRNKLFKGSLKGSIKDITSFINEDNPNKTLLIFEGFMDFLSLFTAKNLTKHTDLKDDVIILNSLSMLDQTIEFINNNTDFYTTIKLYLDSDNAGRQAMNKIMFHIDNIQILDMSCEYKGFKDLNEGVVKNR